MVRTTLMVPQLKCTLRARLLQDVANLCQAEAFLLRWEEVEVVVDSRVSILVTYLLVLGLISHSTSPLPLRTFVKDSRGCSKSMFLYVLFTLHHEVFPAHVAGRR
jgi:hypothetical protein